MCEGHMLNLGWRDAVRALMYAQERNMGKGSLYDVVMPVTYPFDLVKSQQNLSPQRNLMEGHDT